MSFGHGLRRGRSAVMMQFDGRSVFPQRYLSWNPKLAAALMKVLRYIRWEFCRWHWGTKTKQGHRFVTPCSRPITGCLITSAGWPWTELHLDNFDAFSTQFLSKFRSGTSVGDQTPNSLVRTNL